MSGRADLAQALWWAGVESVRGDKSVAFALEQGRFSRPARILAVGKAASAMARAAVEHFGPVPTLIVTKYGHGADAPSGAEVIESAHPVPDAQSLVAGQRLHDAAAGMAPGDHLLLLVSGGASALAELPEAGLTLDEIIAENRRLLSEGLDIHAMNARRRELSRIKGGRLLTACGAGSASVLAISDVEGDDIAVIGSGIGDCAPEATIVCDTHIVASNAIARAAVAAEAGRRGLPVLDNTESLYADVETAAARIARDLKQRRPGIRIWGGEPTVTLPENPGEGGRNQALSLLIAREIAGQAGLTVLVAGTDGTDGPTDAAGGLVTGTTWQDSAADALSRADSGRFLRARDALFTTGPTGTNVMDLVIAVDDGAS